MAVLAIGEDCVGVRRTELIDVTDLPALSQCRQGPGWLLGVADMRGDWLPVISIQEWLQGSGMLQLSRAGKLAVLGITANSRGARGPQVGLLIDGIIGYREVRPSELEALTEPSSWEERGPIRAILGDSLKWLDLLRILHHPALDRAALQRQFITMQSGG